MKVYESMPSARHLGFLVTSGQDYAGFWQDSGMFYRPGPGGIAKIAIPFFCILPFTKF